MKTPRKTWKYQKGQETLKLLGDGSKGLIKRIPNHDDLYAALEQRGYYWNNHDQQWQQDEHARGKGKFSGSMFENADGLPSGYYRLRVMCHPGEVADVCAEVTKYLHVIEVSERAYKNRRGAGVRVYITCKRKDQ